MSTRQQRRRNPPRPVQLTGLLPILLQPVSVTWISGGDVEVVFPQPVHLEGLPAFLYDGTTPPNDAVMTDDVTMLVTYPGPIAEGVEIIGQSWSSNVRGLNGEWVAPFGMAPRSSPGVSNQYWPIGNALRVDPNTIKITFTDLLAPPGPVPPILYGGIDLPSSASLDMSTNVLILVYPNEVADDTTFVLQPGYGDLPSVDGKIPAPFAVLIPS